MIDEYNHPDDKVMYITENIPGPTESSVEYSVLLENFNSQLFCNCSCVTCTTDDCTCVQHSGGPNYVIHNNIEEEKITLNWKHNSFTNQPLIECNQQCLCSENCGNRVVQLGPARGLDIRLCSDKSKGLGLFTKALLPKGSFVCEYAGEVITKSQALQRYQKNVVDNRMNYIFCLNEFCNGVNLQTFVDPGTFGNIGRYINHSCDPNCVIIPVRVDSPIPKLAIFTCKDVAPDAELVFSYGTNDEQSSDFRDRKKCVCRSRNCTGYMPFDCNLREK